MDPVPVAVDLCMLVDRVARRDRRAFVALYEALCRPVTQVACRMLCRDEDVRAVVQGTFVEVWWMARFHTGAGTRVAAWTERIAIRRALDRTGGDDPGRDADDGTNRVAFAALLSRGASRPASRWRTHQVRNAGSAGDHGPGDFHQA
ncbi:sigma factor [Actinoplanes sp. NPDC020271]|uniref:sigma factor n=1 Tax=Actinoplanes sp. NPDC020271 TaxID=3363896 RepID=UPI0037A32831